jgi:hypothetical protein
LPTPRCRRPEIQIFKSPITIADRRASIGCSGWPRLATEPPEGFPRIRSNSWRDGFKYAALLYRRTIVQTFVRRSVSDTRHNRRRGFGVRVVGQNVLLQPSNTVAPPFDEVAFLSVDGVNKSAIVRVNGIASNTVHRWLEKAGVWCRRFTTVVSGG